MKRTDSRALLAAAADGNLWELPYTFVPDRDTVDGYVESALNSQASGKTIPYVIERAGDEQIIGTTRFVNADPLARTVEISHTWIAGSFQGTKVNTEAKYLMLAFAFETLECIRVQLRADKTNIRSRRAIEKIGAIEEGTLRNERMMPDGRKRDAVLYSIIDSEWATVKTRLLSRLGAH